MNKIEKILDKMDMPEKQYSDLSRQLNQHLDNLKIISNKKKQPIIVTTWYFNRFHPHALNTTIAVKKSTDLVTIQTTIAELTKTAKQHGCQQLRLQYKNEELPTDNWLTLLGFKEGRETIIPTAKLSSIPNLSNDEKITFLSGQNVLDLALTSNLIQLATEQYQTAHTISPVSELSKDEWQTLFLTDAILDVPQVAIVDKKIIAWLFAYSDDSKQIEFAYHGGSIAAVKKLWSLDATIFIKRGYESWNKEFDSTDNIDQQLYPWLAKPSGPVYKTFWKTLLD
ncbi:hypothetical protein [Oenococcus sicerae]|uniref:hypothetical protein n=1 Tax=Oenococcus sicerae TaxID=2203724 RepID=UPI0039EC7DA7